MFKGISIFSLSVLVFFVCHPNSFNQHTIINKSDSLFTLTELEIVGLLIISSTMAIVLYSISFNKTKKLYNYFEKNSYKKINFFWVFSIDIVITIILCLFLLALAPQIHYLYYQQIIPDLPNQIVFSSGLSIERFIAFFVLPVSSSIADYSTGFILWVCFLTTMLYSVLKIKPQWFKGLMLFLPIALAVRLTGIFLLEVF
jgi:uncharacterized membrane protein YidH (DUF202 family)